MQESKGTKGTKTLRRVASGGTERLIVGVEAGKCRGAAG